MTNTSKRDPQSVLNDIREAKDVVDNLNRVLQDKRTRALFIEQSLATLGEKLKAVAGNVPWSKIDTVVEKVVAEADVALKNLQDALDDVEVTESQ